MKKRLIIVLMTVALIGSLATILPVSKVEAVAKIKIGDYVKMGKYYGESILWRCVNIDANGPLMLADRILTFKSFDGRGTHKYSDGTLQEDPDLYRISYGSDLWQTSNMRSWLNSTATAGNVKWPDGCPPTEHNVLKGYYAYASEKGFLTNGNFSATERNALKSVNQKSLLNSLDESKLSVGGYHYHINNNDISNVLTNYESAYYHNIKDKMFLLDVKQVFKVYQNRKTLGTNYYIGKPTQKAIDNYEYNDSEQNTSSNLDYWLRSPYATPAYGFNVRIVGSGGNVFNARAYSSCGIRPAFYLNLQTANFKSGNGSKGSPFSLNPKIHVKSVKLNKTTISILKGKTSKLIPTINPSNASNKKVSWKSSNKLVATINTTGTVKGIRKGIAYITVVTVDGKKSAKCKVVVK